MSKTFPIGGIHPPDDKLSASAASERLPIPAEVTIPLLQHIGAPALPVVAKGDRVRTGQLIGEADGFISCNVHSSVTGVVTAIEELPDVSGIRRPCVTIETESDEFAEGIDTGEGFVSEYPTDPDEIIARIAAAGVAGMGGATFPTHVKLTLPPGKKVEYLIVNGAECEPYLTSDYRVMLERGAELLAGAGMLARAVGASKIVIAIEKNKPEAISSLAALAARTAPEISVAPLKARYPQGGEKQLIAAVTGRRVPPGRLPVDVGCLVHNVGTTVAVYEAVAKRKPLYERMVAVTGKGVERPSNFIVRIGAPIEAAIAAAGGLPEDTGKVIIGGPMMGRAVGGLSVPVTKGTSGILLMGSGEAWRRPEEGCIRCAKCVSVCPMALEPYYLSRLSEMGRWGEAEKWAVTDCIECGSCSYACPSNLPLLDWIRIGKHEVMKAIRSRR